MPILPTLALPLLAAVAPAQDEEPPPPPVPVPVIEARDWVAVDGEPARPGRIPGGTTAEATALWNRVLRSRDHEGARPEAIRSFRLTFDGRFRAEVDGMAKDQEVTFTFLEEGPGYLKAVFGDTGKATGRGPDGDWLLDGSQVTRLDGRSNVTSRKNLEQWLALARNFSALCDPSGARLMRLVEIRPEAAREGESLARVRFQERRVEAGDDGQPREVWRTAQVVDLPEPRYGSLARRLLWIEVDSPDFAVQNIVETDLGMPLSAVRVRLGIEEATGRIQLAQIVPLGNDTAGLPRVPVESRAALASIEAWTTKITPTWIPRQVLIFSKVASPTGDTLYEPQPSADLWAKKLGSSLNVPLKPDDFLAPSPK